MTEQKGERSWWQGAADPREVGGREGGSVGTESCFTIIAHVSVASGVCLHPPGHPPAAGPHWHGKPRHRDAFRCRNSPLPLPQLDEGVPVWESIPWWASPPWLKTLQWSRPEILRGVTAFCRDRMYFCGMCRGVLVR